MRDRDISAGCVVASGLWVAVVTLLALSWALGIDHLGRIGLATSAAAATATIRQYFIAQNRHIREAFELGRDSVRPLR